MKINIVFALIFSVTLIGYGQDSFEGRKFEQLGTNLPTPNSYRTASGTPGHEYWQQKADYTIDVTLNDDDQTISGYEEITYTNSSPDALSYLWLQLDQNVRNIDSDTYSTSNSQIKEDLGERSIKGFIGHDFDLGFKILEIKDEYSRKSGACPDNVAQEKEKEKECKKNKKLPFEEEDLKIAKFMYQKILAINSKHKKPNLESWANEIRLMREHDHRGHDEIRDLLNNLKK